MGDCAVYLRRSKSSLEVWRRNANNILWGTECSNVFQKCWRLVENFPYPLFIKVSRQYIIWQNSPALLSHGSLWKCSWPYFKTCWLNKALNNFLKLFSFFSCHQDPWLCKSVSLYQFLYVLRHLHNLNSSAHNLGWAKAVNICKY